MLNIEEVEKKWDSYETEFDETEYMDVEQHTSAAFLVPGLIREVKRLREIIEQRQLPLNPCAVCGKQESNPGLNVCGPCYHKQISSSYE